MLPPGSVVAGYRIERVLGTGGMGVVYLVANPELPRRDALKVLSAELSRDPDFRARFTREADVASVLDHPNITAIYRRGTTEDGQLWIAMQFVDGIDADGALRSGQMSPARAVHIITEVAKALDYAHEHHVVHRDVKPANFLLSGPPGPRERVLLGDFGIARALDEVSITVTGSVTATLAYAAPEVLSGAPVDGRADIYSLGCALFRLLSGTAPYHDAPGAAAVMSAHMHKAPPRITDVAPDLPPAMDGVIATAMAKDPQLRYRTASALAQAAAEALDDRTIPAPRPPIPPAAVYQPLPSAPWTSPPYPQYAAPPPPARAWRLPAAVVGVAVLIAAIVVGAVLLTRRDDGTARPVSTGANTSTASSTPTTTTSAPPTTSTTPAGPPAPPVPASALAGLLLGTDELAAIAGAAGLTVTQSAAVLSDDAPVVDLKECVGAWVPAQRAAYGDSGWSAAQQQLLRSSNDGPPTHTVTQMVVSYPTAADAQHSVDQQSAQWSACAGRVITGTMAEPAASVRYTMGKPATVDGVVYMREAREGGNGWGCERAIGARNNVVIDLMVCRYDPANQAVEAVKAIAAKVPQ